MNKLLIPFLAFVLAGCSFTIPKNYATSSIPVTQGKYTVLAEEVQGSSTQTQWLFFTFDKDGRVQRDAIDDALSQVIGADALVSMTVDEEVFTFIVPFVLPTFYTVYVTGTPVKLTDE